MATSITYTFVLLPSCGTSSRVIRLAWKNLRGGYDSYDFKSGNSESLDIEKVISKSSLPVDYTAETRLNYVNGTDNDRLMQIESEYLTRSYSAWLRQLFLSNDVLWISEGSKIPVVIQNSNMLVAHTNDLIKFVFTMEIQPYIVNY